MGDRTKLEGIYIPVITPFNKDESWITKRVNAPSARRLMRYVQN